MLYFILLWLIISNAILGTLYVKYKRHYYNKRKQYQDLQTTNFKLTQSLNHFLINKQ